MAGCDLWGDQRPRAEVPEDEDIPAALPGAHMDLTEHFSLPLTSVDHRLTGQSVKRPGDPIDLGPNNGQRAEKGPEESD